jgi:hypothetical protein
MNIRDNTQEEVLVDILDEPITSIDALVKRCHPALSAQLWTTCCWPDDCSSWKIGDFNFLVVSIEPDTNTSLYVQFWSEPHESVLMEVGSGERCPGAIRYIGPAQRKALDDRGYKRGGSAKNYQKELVINSASDAEVAAHEALQIVFDVFGYRGQWRLGIKRHRGERAEHDPVYNSVTPEDFAKVAASAGFAATVTVIDNTRLVALKHRRLASLAFMEGQVPRRNLYSLVNLQGELTLTRRVKDEAIETVNSAMRFLKVRRVGPRTVGIRMSLSLDGGVTAGWLTNSLQHWVTSWRECERQLRRGIVPPKIQKTPRAYLVQ